MVTKSKKNKSIISPYYNKPKSMKLIEIVASVEALNKLSDTKLPASVAFSLGKFLKEITSEVETYNKVRGEKIMEYGTPIVDAEGKEVADEQGNKKYSFAEAGSTTLTENGKKFVAEMTEVEQKEIDVKIPEIKIADLGNAVIEPKFLTILSWLVKE